MIIQKTYEQKKSEYGDNMLLLFNVSGKYRAYFKDASKISRILKRHMPVRLWNDRKSASIWCEVCSENELNEVRNRILDAGIGVCTIQIRGNNGKFKI